MKDSDEDKTGSADKLVLSEAGDSGLAEVIKKQAASTPALSDNIGHSWFRALREEFTKKYFVSLSAYLDHERRMVTVYPPVEDVYTWTRHCEIGDVKVVILGQDPYHGPKQAHGLSFSVCRGVDQPPSLKNIFKELQTDVKGFKPPLHGDLTEWAKQGVLLLNAVLTVKAHTPNSHANRGWENLTDAVIKWLNRNNDHIVFMLWGAYAQVRK
jgi:uracil-DNA glycosylase